MRTPLAPAEPVAAAALNVIARDRRSASSSAAPGVG